jgi:hypothetical protein
MTIFATRTIRNTADGTFTEHGLARLDDGSYALVDPASVDAPFVRVLLSEDGVPWRCCERGHTGGGPTSKASARRSRPPAWNGCRRPSKHGQHLLYAGGE